MNNPLIQSNRQKVRLWFEFYKLAIRDPEFKKNIRDSREYYFEWGDVENVKFDDWWKSHKNLFETEVREVRSPANHPNAVTISIPLNQPFSKSQREIKKIVEEKQIERLNELNIPPDSVKSLSVGFGKYEFTRGVEIRGRPLYEILLIYSIFVALGKPTVNSDFCFKVVEWFESRPRRKWIPHILQMPPQKDRKGNLRFDENQIRQIRRYIAKGRNVCESVSLGKFPGRSRL